MSEAWISDETEQKERDYAGLLCMHVKMCKGILARHGGPPYLYVDCHAGPGHLEHNGRQFLGSPLIFQDVATREGIDFHAVHFEQDQAVAARLAEALYVPTSLIDCPDPERSPIYTAPCEDGLPLWLRHTTLPKSRQYGLVYSDPIGKDIPATMLAAVARALPHVDILSYVSATAYKRKNGQRRRQGLAQGTRLAEHIAIVQKAGKPHVLIREHAGAWQWTFILWTSWADFPAWEKRGFHRINTPAGQRILDQLNYTAAELQQRSNQPLWEEGDSASLSTAATRR